MSGLKNMTIGSSPSQAKFLTCEISHFTPRTHAVIFYMPNTLIKLIFSV